MPPPALAWIPEEASAERPVHRSGDYCVQASMMQPRGSRARCLAEDFARDCIPYAASMARRPPGTVYLQRVVHRTEGMVNRISVLLAICFAAGALAAACKTDGTAKNNCVADQCDMVGETEICMQCQSSNIPINGKCIAESGGANADKCKTPTGGKCSACGAGYFLHKGGCYAIGGDPGSFICADEASGSGGTEGVCSTCKTANGFFKHPSPAATKQSCISCSETNNVDGVTGVAGCTACTNTGPAGTDTPKAATCTACSDPKIVKTAAGATSCIDESACNNGFFVETTTSGSTSSKVCTACTDDNCDVCAASGAKKCSKCKTSDDKIYLQKEADS